MAKYNGTKKQSKQSTRIERNRRNSNGRYAENRRSNRNGKAGATDQRIDIPLEDSVLSLVHWAEDERFQPAQPDEDKEGNAFVRRTFDVDGWLDFPRLLLAQGEYYLENADSLLDDDQQEEVEERVTALQKLAA